MSYKFTVPLTVIIEVEIESESYKEHEELYIIAEDRIEAALDHADKSSYGIIDVGFIQGFAGGITYHDTE